MTTLADLIDEVVNGAGYRSPVVNAIANQRPSLPAVKQFERERALALSGPQGNAQDQMSGAYAPQPAPTIENGRYPGADALQFTGLPQLRSGVQHVTNSLTAGRDYQRSADEAGAALPDIALGGLGVLGMLGGSGENLSGPRAAPQMPMQQLNFGRLWESEGAPIVPHDLAFDGARGSYPEGALNNDLDRWVMGGIRSRASELPTLIERQRGFMPGHDMESLIRMANHTRPGEFANILDTDLGEFGVGGKLEGTPLLGTPDIAADPLANTARPGFTRLPELPQRMANRADARWPMFGTLPPEPVTPLPVNPTRELGRASDGSVLPVRPAQPFRQSFVGGSGDLRDAAAMGGNDGGQSLGRPGAAAMAPRDVIRQTFRDIATPEARRTYGENLTPEITDAPADPDTGIRGAQTRNYRFNTSGGEMWVNVNRMGGAEGAGQPASIRWGFTNRDAPNRNLAEALGNVAVAIQRDMDLFGEPAYEMFGASPAHRRVYQQLMESGAFDAGSYRSRINSGAQLTERAQAAKEMLMGRFPTGEHTFRNMDEAWQWVRRGSDERLPFLELRRTDAFNPLSSRPRPLLGAEAANNAIEAARTRQLSAPQSAHNVGQSRRAADYPFDIIQRSVEEPAPEPQPVRTYGAADQNTQTYQFNGPQGAKFEVSVDGDGSVEFSRAGGNRVPVGDMNGAQARSVFRQVLEALRQDAARSGRTAYSFDGYTPQQARIYQQLAQREPGWTVRALEDGGFEVRPAENLNSTTPAFVPLGIGLLGASQTRRSNDNRNTKAPRGAFFHGRSH